MQTWPMLKSYAGQTSPNKHFMQQVREDKRGRNASPGPLRQLKSTTPLQDSQEA